MNTAGTSRKRPPFSVKSLAYSKHFMPYVFVMPFVVSFLIFFLYPTIETVIMSFQKIESLNSVHFIGLKNYQRLWNTHFFNAIKTNTLYTLFSICIIIPIPTLLAVMLNTKGIRGRNIFRSALFIPSLVSTIVAGVAFRLMFSELDTGVFNQIMALFGKGPVAWSMGYWTGMLMMVMLETWKSVGINMIYCLSALQSIPDEIYESADIDGANTVRKFFSITLPMLKPTLIYLLTLTTIAGYRMFTESYVFWVESNPGDIGLTIVRYIYQMSFQRNDMGFGSAIGIVLLGIIMLINMAHLRGFGLFRKEGGDLA